MKRRCTCCGQTVEWSRLPLVGYQDAGDGTSIELRNHTCGTTMGLEVPERPEPERAPCQKLAAAP